MAKPDNNVARSTMNEALKKSTEFLPPEGHSDVGRRVFELLEQVLKYKQDRGLPDRWIRNHELSVGKHWRSKANSKAPVSLVVVNMIATHRRKTVNLLTDNQPTFNITRLDDRQGGDDKSETYESLLKTAEYWWTEEEQQDVLEDSVLLGEETGTVIEKVVFDPTREFGLGEVETITVDPFHFGMLPTSCRSPQKAEACLHFWPMSVREAKRRWPHMASEIIADRETINALGDTREEARQNSTGQRTFSSLVSGLVRQFFTGDVANGQGEDDQLLVVEAWVKDFTRVSGSQKTDLVDSPDGGDITPGQAATNASEYRYTGNIRRVTVGCMGKVVFEDKDNPSINPTLLASGRAVDTYLFDKVPFSFTCSSKDTVCPWGQSDIEQLQSIQEEFNKTLSQFTLFKDKATRLKLINPKDTGVSNSELTNAPGILNPTTSFTGQGIRYLDPPQVPADLVQAMDLFKDLFFLVAGSFDLESAHSSDRGNVIAYKAIAALIEQASTLLRGKIRGYSKMIRERGRMYISHVQNWYTEDRWIAYEEDGEDVAKQIRGSEMVVPAKLTVVSGSTMPRSQVAEREEALALFEKGAIDKDELLKSMDWPDRKAVLRRMAMGPLSEFLTRLETLGAPPEVLGVFQELSQMDPKDFSNSLKGGALPSFAEIAASASPTSPAGDVSSPASPAGLPTPEQVEADKVAAEIRKLEMETALIEEKIRTEQVDQEVKKAGVQFDQEKLTIERARTVQAMHSAAKAEEQAEAEAAAGGNGTGEGKNSGKPSNEHRKGRDERGIVSNNKSSTPTTEGSK